MSLKINKNAAFPKNTYNLLLQLMKLITILAAFI